MSVSKKPTCKPKKLSSQLLKKFETTKSLIGTPTANDLSEVNAPIIDLASGRCHLVEKLASAGPGPIVATDFSPRVLRRDRRWLEAKGLYDRVSLLALDARQTPFKDGLVETLTTNLGLPNIREPGPLFEELRRIVSGKFLAISHFYQDREDGTW